MSNYLERLLESVVLSSFRLLPKHLDRILESLPRVGDIDLQIPDLSLNEWHHLLLYHSSDGQLQLGAIVRRERSPSGQAL